MNIHGTDEKRMKIMRKKQFLSSIAGGLMISCLCVGCANDNVTNEATLEESEEITEENTENNEEEAVSEENSDRKSVV